MNKKNILIVNDDGIEAEGILKLAEAAVHFGRVWIAAPDRQCSGMSQKITIFDSIPVHRVDFPVPVEAAWALGGSPADCVKAALGSILDFRPDIVFSGINNGYNAGFDIAYSGTLGAAMEALMKGIPAIAFSNQYRGGFEAVDRWLLPLMEELLDRPLPPSALWNVNFPGCPLSECRGILYDRTVAPIQIYQDCFAREELPDGGFALYNAESFCAAEDAPENSDVRAVLSGFISVGMLRCALL